MQTRIISLALCGLAILLMTLTVAVAQNTDVAKAGRDIAEKWQSGVISLEVVVNTKMSMGGQNEAKENKNETIGVIVDSSGLTVTALSSLNGMEDYMSSIMDSMPDSMGASKISMSSEIKSLKMIIPGGKDIPAQVVLRDKDLDLAFIRPLKKPDAPMPALDLTQTGDPHMLDQVLSMTRLGPIADRGISMSLGYINAVILKPRKFYIASVGEEMGGPVFTVDGKLVGITALRKLPKGTKISLNFSSPPIIPVIVPTETIAVAAKQAPETETAPIANEKPNDAVNKPK